MSSRLALAVVFVLVIASANANDKRTKPGKEKAKVRGYKNKCNRLIEYQLDVKDEHGKPAVIGFTDPHKFHGANLKIIWTEASQYSWNYCLPELHDGKNLFETAYPSIPVFLKKKWRAKKSLSISVPDTPYSFYVIDGEFVPLFHDSEKDVLWQMTGEDMLKAFEGMRTVSVSSRKITFAAGGGDCATFLIVDFSDRDKSPAVTYYTRYDGP